MSRSTSACNQQNSTRTLPHQQHVLVVKRHHLLVRWSHWLNVPIILGLVLSGVSIYWASPVYQHKPDPVTQPVTTDRSPATGIAGGYDNARIWHFWLMWVFIFFVVPHVMLVLVDGWDTLRSMIVGWSTRAQRLEDL